MCCRKRSKCDYLVFSPSCYPSYNYGSCSPCGSYGWGAHPFNGCGYGFNGCGYGQAYGYGNSCGYGYGNAYGCGYGQGFGYGCGRFY